MGITWALGRSRLLLRLWLGTSWNFLILRNFNIHDQITLNVVQRVVAFFLGVESMEGDAAFWAAFSLAQLFAYAGLLESPGTQSLFPQK